MQPRIKLETLFLLAGLLLYSITVNADIGPPSIGNFSLPSSQQPAPLISAGDNIINKGEIQLLLYNDNYAGVNEHFIDVVPSMLYGIRDDLSLLLSLPVAASFQQKSNKSAGLEDALAQIEYAYYNSQTATYTQQATLFANITFPTGSIYKNPTTGYGSPSFLLAGNFNRTYVDWFLFGTPGAIFTTAKSGTKFGNSYLYQFGIGKNISDKNGWLLAWLTEIDGTYMQRNRMRGMIDINSGGNIVYLTPSVWASTKKLIVQLGVGLPITQHLLGNQPRETCLIAFNLGWSIY